MAVLREVVIVWNDAPEDNAHLVTVSIDEAWNSIDDGWDDDEIFWYFASEQEFEQAKTGDGYEFTIIEWEDNDE